MGEAQNAFSEAASILGFDFFFGIVKGVQPLTRYGEWSPEVGGGSENTPPYLWAWSASRLTKKKTAPPPARETAIPF